jgi:hypothetical protein
MSPQPADDTGRFATVYEALSSSNLQIQDGAGDTVLRCTCCSLLTTVTEAHSRISNVNRCGFCGGDLDWT